MAEETSFSRTALLVMDVQNGIVERLGNDPLILGPLAVAIAAARQAEMLITYVVVRFRNGYPESRNAARGADVPAYRQ